MSEVHFGWNHHNRNSRATRATASQTSLPNRIQFPAAVRRLPNRALQRALQLKHILHNSRSVEHFGTPGHTRVTASNCTFASAIEEHQPAAQPPASTNSDWSSAKRSQSDRLHRLRGLLSVGIRHTSGPSRASFTSLARNRGFSGTGSWTAFNSIAAQAAAPFRRTVGGCRLMHSDGRTMSLSQLVDAGEWANVAEGGGQSRMTAEPVSVAPGDLDGAQHWSEADAVEATKMLNVTISTIMLLASGHTAIPVEYYMWTELFLKTIKDENGQHPTNVRNLLEYMRQLRAQHQLSWDEASAAENERTQHTNTTTTTSQTPAATDDAPPSKSMRRTSRIPVALGKHKSAIGSASRKTPSEPSLMAQLSATAVNGQHDAFRAYYMSMARQPGFNKIIHRLIFAGGTCLGDPSLAPTATINPLATTRVFPDLDSISNQVD